MNDDMKQEIESIINEYNHRGLPEFEGYSPKEMREILYNTFGERSPMHLKRLDAPDYRQIPMFNQVRYLAKSIIRSGELKLTAKGYLPPKIVEELYAQGFLKEELIEYKMTKVFREWDLKTIALARILLEVSGMIKKRHGKLSPTKAAEKILADDHECFRRIFTAYTDKFYWPYLDGYVENGIGKLGYGFSLILLCKYGDEKRCDRFYSDRYFRAFPHLMAEVPEPLYGSAEQNALQAYTLRTFKRFLTYFGLVVLSGEERIHDDMYIRKTDLFDRLFACDPPGTAMMLQNLQYSSPGDVN
ncbi:MAG: hypothetical protein U5N56_07190 [Candidatus Marinimicrobia bacterium]|nr:hypothetical protein [Candidatus Neomarinimicrobiota bacterium]